MNFVKEIETELSMSFEGGLSASVSWLKKEIQLTKLLACRKTVCFFLPRCCKRLSHGMILIFCRIIYLCHVTLAKMVNISGKFYIFMKWQTMVCPERQEIVLIKENCIIVITIHISEISQRYIWIKLFQLYN